MIYKLVNSKKIIGKLFEDRNIDYSGFISRVPNWVFAAMRKINVPLSYINATVDGEVIDYKALLPDETKILLGVSYKGYRLPRLDRVNEAVTDDMPNLIHSEYKYQLDNNGYIITTFEKCNLGELKFYIKKFPLECDIDTKLYFPLIPDNEELYSALEQYVLMMLLQRGHKVNNLSLTANNEFINPALGWEKYKRIAKNSLTRYDNDEREVMSKMIRTFILDYDSYGTEFFNNKNIK